MASIVGSSWNAAEISGLAPIRSPAPTMRVLLGFSASSARMCVARYAMPPATTVPPGVGTLPPEPVGGSRLPWKSLIASSWTSTVGFFGAPTAAVASIDRTAAVTRIHAARTRRMHSPPTNGRENYGRRRGSTEEEVRLSRGPEGPRACWERRTRAGPVSGLAQRRARELRELQCLLLEPRAGGRVVQAPERVEQRLLRGVEAPRVVQRVVPRQGAAGGVARAVRLAGGLHPQVGVEQRAP